MGRRNHRKHHKRGQKKGRDASSSDRKRPKSKQHRYVGTIQKHAQGFAFILPDDPTVPDAYVSRSDAAGLLNGDKVEFSLQNRRGRASGRIWNLLERSQKKAFGYVERHGDTSVLMTEDAEYVVKAPNGKRPRANQWVIANIEEYPTRFSAGEAIIETALGNELVAAHDLAITIAKFGLAEHFPVDALEEAKTLQGDFDPEDLPSWRQDLRHIPFVTIDGADAKDFDDAVCVRTAKGKAAFVLYVAIADVSHFVRPESPLDKEAVNRSTSVYLPGTCLPMLPEEISNDLCSLRPREPKYALVCEIHFNREGVVVHSDFYNALIQTWHRLTYDQVEAYFARDEKVQKKLENVAEMLGAMNHLFKRLRKQRAARGALDFELDKGTVSVGKDGFPTAAMWEARLSSHQLIEEFMIAANVQAARLLREKKLPGLYRAHESPDAVKLDEVNFTLRNLGVGKRIKDLRPKTFSKLLKETQGLKVAPALHNLLLRVQKQAHYTDEPKGHFGLNLKDYSHFTSPIRRYPDLVVHRAIKSFIGNHESAEKKRRGNRASGRLASLGDFTSQRERRAMEAERFCLKRKQCWFMSRKVGRSYPGVVRWVVERGLFIAIADYGIEGFLEAENLPGYFEFDEARFRFVQRPGKKSFGIGDKIRIKVTEVYVEDKEINLSCA